MPHSCHHTTAVSPLPVVLVVLFHRSTGIPAGLLARYLLGVPFLVVVWTSITVDTELHPRSLFTAGKATKLALDAPCAPNYIVYFWHIVVVIWLNCCVLPLGNVLQGPPGTGKTSAIIAIISTLLAKHFSPPNPKAKTVNPGASSSSLAQDGPSSTPTVVPKALLPGSQPATLAAQITTSGQASSKGRAGPGGAPAPAPKFRVLVCAQSNAAIDEVIARLADPGLLMGKSRQGITAYHGSLTPCLPARP